MTSNNYRFTGEQFDPNLGDYYLRDRYYGTDIGRFTRADTFQGSISNPISLHDYLYANGNPVIFTDPTGMFSMAEAVISSVIISILADLVYPDPLAGSSDGSSPGNPVFEKVLFSVLLGILTNNVGKLLNSATEVAETSLGSSVGQLNALTGNGANFSYSLKGTSTDFQSRVVALTEDVASGAGRQVQAIGGARLERVLGRQIQPSSNSTYDFFDPSGLGKIELKGPFLTPKTLEPVTKFRSIAQITSGLNSKIANSSSDATIIIDTLGLNDTEILYLAKNIISGAAKVKFMR